VIPTRHVEPEWIDALHNDDLTEVAFSGKVIETIEPAEGSISRD